MMTGMVGLAAGAGGMPEWVASIAKIAIGVIILIALLNFFLSSGGPKGGD